MAEGHAGSGVPRSCSRSSRRNRTADMWWTYGRLGIPAGAVHVALARLEREGLVSAEWREQPSGPRRMLYRATDAGREKAQEGR